MKVYEVDITPMGTVRMIHRGRTSNKYAFNYMQYKNTMKAHLRRQHAGEPLTGPLHVTLTFRMTIPKNGMSQNRKVKDGDYVTTKPDIDNMIKAVLDSANSIVFNDDNQVCRVSAVKVYGDVPGIRMEVREL